jgi:hypothetical protein
MRALALALVFDLVVLAAAAIVSLGLWPSILSAVGVTR